MPFTSDSFAFGGERLSDSHNPFPARSPTAPSLEALSLVRSITLPLARERYARSAGPFALRACGRRVFGSALPYAKHSSSFGARTGRALQNCCAQAKGKANAVPMARSLRGVDAFVQSEGYPLARPSEGPSPKAEPMDCSRSVCKPFCSARPVRAPEEEHWQSTWQSASKDAQAQARRAKGER